MSIKIPTYQDRLQPEGFVTPRATTPDMTFSTAGAQGLRAFGEAMGNFGAQQYHLERQRANNDASTSALADLAEVRNQVQQDLYNGIDKMGEGATLAGDDGQTRPWGEAMQGAVKSRYDTIAQKYANASPEVKNFVARHIISAQEGWNATINSEAEKGTVVQRLTKYDEGVKARESTAMTNPAMVEQMLEENKVATAQLGISPEGRYQRLIQTQQRIVNAALQSLRNNPDTNAAVIQSLQERLGNFKDQPNPYTSQPGVAAGFTGNNVANSTDLGAITQATKAAEGNGKSSTSSSSGLYGFIKSTFIRQARKSFPDLTAGKSDNDVLAMRGQKLADGTQIEEVLGSDHVKANADALFAAGFAPNGTNVYLAHFLGIDGALRVLRADPNTPVEQVTDMAARRDNGSVFKPGMTAANLINWAGNTINRNGGGSGGASAGGQPASSAATTKVVPDYIRGLVNKIEPEQVEQSLLQSMNVANRQAAASLTTFNATIANHQAMAMAGESIQTPLTLADFQKHHPYDGEAQYDNYAANMQAGATLNSMKVMPIDQARAAVEAYRPNPDAPGFAAAQVRYNALADGLRQLDAARQKDQVGYAIQNKVGEIKPINIGDSGSIIAEMRTRAAVANVMRDKFRTNGVELLSENEANGLKDFLFKAPINDQMRVLQAMKAGISDERKFIATMNQIAPDHPIVALAGKALMHSGEMSSGRWIGGYKVNGEQLAKLLLEGNNLLNPSREQAAENGRGSIFKMPDAKLFDAQFDAATNGLFVGERGAQSRHILYQAVRAAYAAKMANDNKFDGTFDGATVKDMVEFVSGGISSSYKVVRPWGMPEDTFSNNINKKYAEVMKREGMSGTVVDNVNAIKLRDAERTNAYWVTDKSGVPIMGKTSGEPIMLDLSPNFEKVPMIRGSENAPQNLTGESDLAKGMQVKLRGGR